jgi:hypothetical protein
MIGFTSSKFVDSKDDGLKRVRMDFPVVLPGNEGVVDLLFDKSIEAFREMGVMVIESTFGLWGGSDEWAEKWGYKKVKEVGVLYGLDTYSWRQIEVTGVSEFNPDSDLDIVVNYFSSQFDLSKDEVEDFTMRLFNSENKLAYFVVKDQGKLLASGALEKNPNIPSLGSLSAVQDEGIQYLEILMNALVSSGIKNDIERIFMFFTHLSPGHPLIEKFASIGFRYLGVNAFYEKRI